MIKYSCKDATSMGKAHHELIFVGVKHKVIGELVLGFRERPTRQAKEILTRCGFTREADTSHRAPTAEEVWNLKEKFS